MTTEIVRLDRLEAGLVAWIGAALPTATVLEAPSELPQPAAGDLVVTFKALGVPKGEGASTVIRSLPTSVTFRIGTPVVGEAIRIMASGRGFEYEVQIGDDAEAVRDGLLAEFAADDLVSFAAAADATDGIVLTPTESGDLYNVSVRQTAAGMISEESRTTAAVECQIEDVLTLVEIMAWSLNRYASDGAVAALTRLLGTRRLQAPRRVMIDHGITIEPVSRPVDVSFLSGPKWSSAATFTAYVRQVSLAAAAVETIDQARGTMTVRTPDGSDLAVAIDSDNAP